VPSATVGWLNCTPYCTPAPLSWTKTLLVQEAPCALVSHIFLSVVRCAAHRALISGNDVTSDAHCSVVLHSSSYSSPATRATIEVLKIGFISLAARSDLHEIYETEPASTVLFLQLSITFLLHSKVQPIIYYFVHRLVWQRDWGIA